MNHVATRVTIAAIVLFVVLGAGVYGVIRGANQDGSAQAASRMPNRAHRLLTLVREIDIDYGEAMEEIDPSFRKHVQQTGTAALQAATEMPNSSDYVPELQKILADMESSVQPYVVENQARALMKTILANEKVDRAPSRLPSRETAGALFQRTCAGCHGADGKGNGPAAANLNPQPANLQKYDLMNSLSPFDVYSFITFGISGTAMPAQLSLSDDERWALAFYVFTLRHTGCDKPGEVPPLAELARSTDNELTAHYGDAKLPCLRYQPFH